jgi:hypothetical protein
LIRLAARCEQQASGGYRQPAATNRFRTNHQNTIKAASRRWNPLSEKSAKAIRSFLRVAFGLSRDTISKMCRYSAPPGYVRSKQPERPKLGPLVPVIDAILEADKTAPPKQRAIAANASSSKSCG